MMATDSYRQSRLSRRLYEASIVLAFATILVSVLLLVTGMRTHGRFACAAKSIATASARCAGAAEIGHDLPSTPVNVVFSADPSPDDATR
jgi:hypothetical protein